MLPAFGSNIDATRVAFSRVRSVIEQHDIHDAYAPDQKVHGRDRAEQHGHHPGRAGKGFRDLAGVERA